MNWSLKQCTSTASWDHVDKHSLADDRLTNLRSELLIHMLSLLPTKDVAATCVLNKRLSHVFPFVTSLDFDISPISFCVEQPYAIQHFPVFVAFVNAVLQAHRSEFLTRFRLQVGSSSCRSFGHHLTWRRQKCFPDSTFTQQLSSCISFPLKFCSLRELDLCILVKEPRDAQLPPAIFSCQSLELFKLGVNIGLDQVFSVQSYHLPNVRFLTLRDCFVSDDSFLTRLLACCPLLEDLTYDVFTNHVSHITIKSASLRRLSLIIRKVDGFEDDNPDIVTIHAPYLEYLYYFDNLALSYSIPITQCLVRAKLFLRRFIHAPGVYEVLFLQIINLLRSVSHVQRLSLGGIFLMEFDDVDVNYLKDHLPVFPNLNYLVLDFSTGEYYWNKFLLLLLNCSPILEILIFPRGVLDGYDDRDFDGESHRLEREFLASVHPIPSCCRHHLKRIVIKKYVGLPREEEIVLFFLRHALVLEELIIYLDKEPPNGYPFPDEISIKSSMMNLQNAFDTCSIQVLW